VGLKDLDFVGLGGLFLLAFVGPAYLDGGTVLPAGDKTDVVVITALVGAAGIGALLQLAGRALWDFGWPMNPNDGRLWFLWKSRKLRDRKAPAPWTFRSDIAEGVPNYKADAASCFDGSDKGKHDFWNEGDQIVVVTQYLFYTEAPAELREWVRRRYYRFSDGLSVVVAIGLGVALGLRIPGQNLLGLGLTDGVLALVAVATLIFASASRRDAKHMEAFWFKENRTHPPESSKLAFEPGTEVGVRLGIRK
jgi:hypothetical protein